MHKLKGWNVNKTQYPSGFHFAITQTSYKQWKDLVNAIKETVQDMKKDPSLNHTNDTAIYGMVGMCPDGDFVDEFARNAGMELMDVQY